VTFTKVLTIYHSWIHPLHHSSYPPSFHSWNSFNRSHFSIYIWKNLSCGKIILTSISNRDSQTIGTVELQHVCGLYALIIYVLPLEQLSQLFCFGYNFSVFLFYFYSFLHFYNHILVLQGFHCNIYILQSILVRFSPTI
jgi:hypothetical protein